MKRGQRFSPVFPFVALALAAGCSAPASTSTSTPIPPATANAAPKGVSAPDAAASTAPAPQKLNLAFDSPTVGAKVRATAAGLPPGKAVEITWGTVTGGWVIEGYYHFKGK